MGATAAGTKLGRYQIVKHLASGGMAEVLLARATGIEGFTRHVVIKRIRPGQAKDQNFVQMFLNEARLAAQLHHANIVQVHDIGQEGNEYFFAMEYVHGEDLRRLLTHLARHKQKVPVDHVVTIIAAAANALHHAHEQRGPDRKPLGLVHRDVTPANILVGYDGNVKVVDFGIAKAVAKKSEETAAGTLKGKASYMSPEQCTGGRIDRRSDVFALGIVLYELVTTRRLFKAENDFLTMTAVVGGKIPPPRTHRPDLPEALEAIIMKALALKPEDRYQTADEMREALEQFATNAGLRTSTHALAAYMKQQFGERPEPWLVEDDDAEIELTVDFDGTASGMAPPPQESINELAIPETMETMKSSPILKARTKAASNSPPRPQAAAAVAATAKKPLPAAPTAKPPKTRTAQIPIATVPPAAEKSKSFRLDPTPMPVATPRRQTRTVQIPSSQQTAGVAPKPSESTGVPLPGVGHVDDSAATVVSSVPMGVDTAWDPSRPIAMAASANTIAAEQAVSAAKSEAEAPKNGAAQHASEHGNAPAAAKPATPQPVGKKTPPTAFAKLPSVPVGGKALPSVKVTKPVDKAPDADVEPSVVGNPLGAIALLNELSSSEPDSTSSALSDLASFAAAPKPQDAPNPKFDVASLSTVMNPDDISAASKFDNASLSSPRTMASVPAAAAAPDAAGAVATADRASGESSSEGRDSAPSLPPPPVARTSVKLPGVAAPEGNDAGNGAGVAAKFGAQTATALAGARPTVASSMPEAWPGGSSAVRAKRSPAALIRSPKYIAIAAGALLVAVVVIVFATGGDDKQTTAAPEKPTPVEPAPANVAAPVEPTPTAAEPAEPAQQPSEPAQQPSEPAQPTEPVAVPAAPEPIAEPVATKAAANSQNTKVKPTKKAPPKKVAAKPSPKKPAAKPAPKTKPAVKKTSAKKPAWDPNSLFPKRK